MSDVDAGAQSPQESILEEIARAEGEPSLFPPEVLRLHREGRAIRARKELLRAAKEERNDALAQRQRAQAANLRLWQDQIGGPPSMYTLNGVGTRLYGRDQPASDGTHIGTLWFTFVFAPIWPLAAYLVLPAPTGGWHFLSKTPLPTTAMATRRWVGAAISVLVLFIAYSMYWSGTHAVVHAFNGFDQPVEVTVGEVSQLVPPRQAAVFDDVPAATTRFASAWGGNEEPFESIDVDLRDRARETVVYNVGGRAVLRYDWIAYGDQPPAEGHLLEAGPVLFEDDVDFPFTEPPDSMSVADGETAQRSVLYAIDDGMTAEGAARQLLEIGRVDQARTVAFAELEVHPEDGALVLLMAMAEYGDDQDAQVALFRSYLERAPDAVDLHRYYQELWPEDSPELRAEYDELLEANPQSPMYHYLVGRIAAVGSAAGLAHYNEATRLEPGYPPALRALAYHGMSVGDWSTALDRFAEYAAVGPAEANEVADARARIAVRLGRPWEEVDAILEQGVASGSEAIRLALTRAHRAVHAGELSVTDAVNVIHEQIEQVFGPAGPDVRASLTADLAITTGDLTRARSELDGLGDPSFIDPSVAQRLALSEGATAADRERLQSIPGWPFSSNPMEELLALRLVDDEEARDQLMARMDPSIVRVVEFFESDEITRADRLSELTAEFPPSGRMWVHFAAASMLTGDAPAAGARQAYLDEAESLALPGDLPFRR